MTVVTLHQPHYLPWLGLLDKFDRSDLFVFVDHVQFERGGWQNRNRVLTRQGPTMLTVPLLHRSAGEPIDEKVIDERKPWRRKHFATIAQAYADAPHAGKYLAGLADLYAKPWTLLRDLNIAMTLYLAQAFGITTPWLRSSDLGPWTTRKTALVVDMIRRVGADTFLSGDGATYYDDRLFTAAGITVVRQQFRHPVYPQVHSPGRFTGRLAGVDLLLHAGPSALSVLRSANQRPTREESR